MEPVSLTALAGKLIFTGCCLAIGFWCGKKITNRIDEFLYTRSKEYRDLRKEREAPVVQI